MDNNEEKKGTQISVEISEEVAEGVYSNMAVISHSSSEFVVDFLRILPNTPKAKVKSRVVLTPEHAKRLMLALQENLSKYEAQYGKIGGHSGNDGFSSPFPINLSGTGEA